MMRAIKTILSLGFLGFSLMGNKAFAESLPPRSDALLDAFCAGLPREGLSEADLDLRLRAIFQSVPRAELPARTRPRRVSLLPDAGIEEDCRQRFRPELQRAYFILGARHALHAPVASGESDIPSVTPVALSQFYGTEIRISLFPEALGDDSAFSAETREAREAHYAGMWRRLLSDLRTKMKRP